MVYFTKTQSFFMWSTSVDIFESLSKFTHSSYKMDHFVIVNNFYSVLIWSSLTKEITAFMQLGFSSNITLDTVALTNIVKIF
jgi:hypothetical protein